MGIKLSTSEIRIAVIIPVYGNWEDTTQCLTALEAQSVRDFQVMIADDGSPTPPPAEIQNSKLARYIKGDHAGYGANCNRAAREAIALGATHLLFLNSDTTFGTAFMEVWIKRAGEMPHSILSPLIYWSRYPNRIWSSGGKRTVFTPFVRSRTCFREVTEVDTVTGCAILVPVGVWAALSGFDPTYAMYFEDFDFTLRAKAKGTRTYIVPDPELSVLHHVSGSFRGTGAWNKHYLMLTSSLIFIRSHYRGVGRAVCLALGASHLVWTALVSLPELPQPGLLRRALVRGFSGRTSNQI
jgi:GT2 family glycosyltransferase